MNIDIDDYYSIKGLRAEAAEKLDRIRPVTVGQASRISGVNPADVNVLILSLKKSEEGDFHFGSKEVRFMLKCRYPMSDIKCAVIRAASFAKRRKSVIRLCL